VKLLILSLEDACLKITDGTHHSPPITTSGIPYVTAKHVKPEGLKFFEDPWFVSEEDHRAIYSRCDPKKGDVLYIKDGATTGIAALNNYDFPFSMLSSVALLRPKPEVCDPRFLCWWLNSPLSKEKFIGQMGGAAIKRLTLSKIKRFEIPLPPLAEQRRIAEVLDRAEALRAKRRAALAELDSLTQSLFLDLFGDPRANERHWELHRIESFISDMRGGAALEPDDFVDSGFPILHKGAIKANGIIGIDAKKKTFATPAYAAACPKNIVSREFVAVTLRDLVPAGPSIGFTADLRNGPFDEYLLAQGAYGFRVNRESVLPEYLVHLSNNENFRHVLRQNAVGSTQIHIRTPIYLAIRVPLPPIALQQEFARRVGAVEKLKQAQRAALAEQDALFATLQHRAFRGEL
jgi:type I restriction enzyme S subunit